MNNTPSSETLQVLENSLLERLDDYGFRHSCGVSSLSCTLATLYGVDPLDAAFAGLLHDWDRCETDEDLLEKAYNFHIEVDEVLRANPHLLHAHTGAHSVHEYFLTHPELGELPQGVQQAIANHTVGCTNMTELDMVVYVADMIEPSRMYPGVDTLREMVGTVSLQALFLQCYQKTMEFLVKKRRLIHPDTLKVWNHYMADTEVMFETKGVSP